MSHDSLDEELALAALEKQQAGLKLTVREKTALNRVKKARLEKLRYEICSAIPAGKRALT